ncbi:Histone deacetylase [Phytophthora megakarya]|uniref:Histone deacetylase n=1 Tax=Phytophthora megakarya TaxID=4795 RepID=A0A225WV27_9STRA|nr:Histone deacetylase [Phytophthora megakarya]
MAESSQPEAAAARVSAYAAPRAALDEDDDYDEEEDTYLLHNLAEQGRVNRLRALLPLPSQCSEAPPRLSVLSSETSLLEKDDMGLLPLHVAVIHQQTDVALHLLRYSPALTSAMLRLKGGDFGTPFLHLVLRVGAINAPFSELLITELFSPKEDKDFYGDDVRALLFEKVAARDEEGNTVFHLCARYDLAVCLDILASFYTRQLSAMEAEENKPVGEKKKKLLKLDALLEKGNKVGFRALHEAMKYQAASAARRLVNKYIVDVNPVTPLHQTPAHIAALADFGEGVEILRNSPQKVAANFALKDSHGCTPAQVARKCAFNALETRLEAAEAGNSVAETGHQKENVPQKDQTRFFFHPEVWKHLPMSYHRRGGPDPPPENPERIDTLVDPVFGILKSREFQRPNVEWDYDIERADIADILLVHEFHYVDRIRQKCASLGASVQGKEPVASKNDGSSNNHCPCQPNLKASSSDDAEECHAAFLLDMDTALSVRSYDAASRAAGAVCKAVDEVVAGKCRNAFCIVRPPGHHAGPVGKVVCENDPEGSLGFCLFNNVAVGAAYARAHLKHRGINKVAILDFDVHHGNGTEEIVRQLVPSTKEITFETPYGVGKQVVHQYKPWRSDDDSENVFFCSVHGYGHKDPENKEELPKGETQGWFYPGSGVSDVKESPIIWDEGMPFCQEGSSASRLKWRSAFRDRILPKLREFNPDLIFLSAGFDAHKKELVNWGYVSLLEQDYEWLVAHVKQVANSCCDGRLISVLEGGYNFHGRMVSPFARSVAAHTRALINPAQEHWDEDEIAKEAAHEHALLANYLAPAATATSGITVLQTKKRCKADNEPLAHSRSKRTRKEVDYVALAKELAEQ